MKTVIVDGNQAIWRLFHKLPVLTTSKGQPVQIVYGFLKLLRGVLNDFQPDAALVAWDEGLPRIRLAMWPDYKKKRIASKQEPDEERKRALGMTGQQIGMLRTLLPVLGINQYWVDGLEADDIISLACKSLPGKRIVVSSDTDMLQLVRKGVLVYRPPMQNTPGKRYHQYNFEKHFGVTPYQYLEVKALAGDSTDGIPGVAIGFGEVTAKKLILEYGNLKSVLKAKHTFTKGLANRMSYDGVEKIVERNLQLMDLRLMSSPTAEKQIRKMVMKPKRIDLLVVTKYLKQHEFQSLLDDFLGWIGPFKRLGAK